MTNPSPVLPPRAFAGVPWPLLVLAVAALVCVIVIGLTRPCLNDEAYYLEPGINMLNGRGFVSGFGWPNDLSAFWGSSTPGMSLVYASWFWLVGFGFFQSKLLSVIIHLVGALLVIRWAKERHQLSPADSTILFILLLGLPSMVTSACSCRPDVFGLIFTACYLHLMLPARGEERVRPFGLAVLGFGIVTIALHHAFYFAVLTAGLFMAHRTRQRFLNGVLLAVGMLVAAAVLYKVYSANGAWDDFVAARKWHYEPASQGYMTWVARGPAIFTTSPDMLLLAVFAAVAVAAKFFSGRLTNVSGDPNVAALAVFFTVPVAMTTAGIFYRAYAWMVVVPVLLLLLPQIASLWTSAGRRYGPVLAVVATAALCSASVWRVDLNRKLAREVDNAMQTLLAAGYDGEPAVISPDLYYPMKALCKDLYISLYPYWPQSGDWPPASRSRIRWVIGISPERLGPGLGGRCTKVEPVSGHEGMFKVWRRDP